MKELIEFAKNYAPRYSYLPEEVLEDAKSAGLIKSYQDIGSEITNERRWGHDQETVFRVDDSYVLFDVYVMTGDEGDDELNYIYEVKPAHDLKAIWKIVEENDRKDSGEHDENLLTLEEFRKGISGIPDGYDDYHIDHMASMLGKIISRLEEKFFITKDDLIEMINQEIEFADDWRKELKQ